MKIALVIVGVLLVSIAAGWWLLRRRRSARPPPPRPALTLEEELRRLPKPRLLRLATRLGRPVPKRTTKNEILVELLAFGEPAVRAAIRYALVDQFLAAWKRREGTVNAVTGLVGALSTLAGFLLPTPRDPGIQRLVDMLEGLTRIVATDATHEITTTILDSGDRTPGLADTSKRRGHSGRRSPSLDELERVLHELGATVVRTSDVESEWAVRLARASKAIVEGNTQEAESLVPQSDVDALGIANERRRRLEYQAIHIRCLAATQGGRWPEALELVDRLEHLEPRVASVLLLRGFILEHLKRLEEALAAYQTSALLAPDDPWALCNAGNVLARLGRNEAALEALDRCLSRDGGHMDAYFNRGVILNALSRPAEALESLDRVREEFEHDPRFFLERAEAFESLDRRNDASIEYSRALELDPLCARAHSFLAILLAKSGSIPEALDHAERATSIEPNHEFWHYNRGIVLGLAGRPRDAVLEYRRATELRKSYWEAFRNLSAELYEVGEFEEAAAAAQEAVRLAGTAEQAVLFLNLSIVQRRLARHAEALESLRQAAKSDPTNVRIHFEIACEHAALGHSSAALDELERILPVMEATIRAKVPTDPALEPLWKDQDPSIQARLQSLFPDR